MGLVSSGGRGGCTVIGPKCKLRFGIEDNRGWSFLFWKFHDEKEVERRFFVYFSVVDARDRKVDGGWVGWWRSALSSAHFDEKRGFPIMGRRRNQSRRKEGICKFDNCDDCNVCEPAAKKKCQVACP